jgi:hypothetical protein
MADSYDLLSEHEYELIGRIRSLDRSDKGDQVVIYYNYTTLKVEVYVEKFENSVTKIVKLTLSIEETKKLIELLEKTIGKNNDHEGKLGTEK